MLGGLLSAHGACSISILLGEKHEPFFNDVSGEIRWAPPETCGPSAEKPLAYKSSKKRQSRLGPRPQGQQLFVWGSAFSHEQL